MKGGKWAYAAIALIFMCQAVCLAARENTLSDLVNSGKPIKVFVKEFDNETNDAMIKPDIFKVELEKAFSNRKSVIFQVVKHPVESDVQVSGILKKFQYLDRGPLKAGPGAGGILLDAAASATHNYAEMEAYFTITDTKTSQVLWSDLVNVYKKKVMTPQDSVGVIYDKISRIFLSKSFGKGKN